MSELSEREIIDVVRKRLLGVPHVVEVAISPYPDVILVHTFVDDFSREARTKVYDAEALLVDEFRDTQFAFRVRAAAEKESVATPRGGE